MHITPTYRGDLVLDLVTPDGTAYRLKNSSSDSTPNIDTTYTVNASSEAANGAWQLRIETSPRRHRLPVLLDVDRVHALPVKAAPPGAAFTVVLPHPHRKNSPP